MKKNKSSKTQHVKDSAKYSFFDRCNRFSFAKAKSKEDKKEREKEEK